MSVGLWEPRILQEVNISSSLHAPSEHHWSSGPVGVRSTDKSVLQGVGLRFPAWFVCTGPLYEEFQCAVPFPSVLEETFYQLCLAVKFFRSQVRGCGPVFVRLRLVNCRRGGCNAINGDAFDQLSVQNDPGS